MNRKTVISGVADYSGECMAYIQSKYQAKGYGVECSKRERRGGRRARASITNAKSGLGVVLRSIFSWNVGGTLTLTVQAQAIQVKVTGKLWAKFFKAIDFLLGLLASIISVWMILKGGAGEVAPLLCIGVLLMALARIGLARQKKFLDQVYQDAMDWLSFRRTHDSLHYACPHCGKPFFVDEASEEYLVPCPGCGERLDLTELDPL